MFKDICRLMKFLIAPCLALAAMNSIVEAVTHNVSVNGLTFTPANLPIDVGDTVIWTWGSGAHNVESGVSGSHDGNFRSGDPVANPGLTYQIVFDQAFLDANPMPNNQYPYYCAFHFSLGMVGTITVDPGSPACPADFAGSGGPDPDGQVDVFDLFVLLSNWSTDGEGAALADPTNVVDVFDLFVLLSAWGDC